jgi:hypothetical protein
MYMWERAAELDLAVVEDLTGTHTMPAEDVALQSLGARGARGSASEPTRPHPGAQLRITDADGMRLTCFATNTTGTAIAALELRHRQRARAEDRIRAARDTGLRNLPLHDTAQNRIWLEIVQLALDLLAWMPMLALTGETRRWEPKRLRLRLFSAAAHLVTTGRCRWLRLGRHWPWTLVITTAFDRLQALPNPD